nr:exocyst complex component EXO70B1 [Arachis hypogaea]
MGCKAITKINIYIASFIPDTKMADSGEEKLLAVARHIAKTLGNDNRTVAEDILKIFSNFDARFSKEKLSDPLGCAALEQTLDSLDERISRHVSSRNNNDNSQAIFSVNTAAFLASVDELTATVNRWRPLAADETVGACLSRADEMLRRAMVLAEDEFRSLMDESIRNTSFESDDGGEFEGDDESCGNGVQDHRIPAAERVSEEDVVIDVLPAGTVIDLREIATRMVAAGFGDSCARVYGGCRREFLEESFSRLGFRNLCASEIQEMPWQVLEDEIERWINASNVSLRILFPSERRLCDRVFSGGSAADIAFGEVCREPVTQLLRFADAVASHSRSPDQLFRILHVFDTMRELIPEFASLFSDSQCETEAIEVWKRLGEAIKEIFVELENLIRHDPAKAAVHGGGLHPITKYVVNYLVAASQSRRTLELVFQGDFLPLKDFITKVDDNKHQSDSHFCVQLCGIMDLLESNLEAKSKFYKDLALCSVFMMNNLRYIVQKAKTSELGPVLGDDWIRKHTAKIRRFHVSYQRSSWSKVVGFLKVTSEVTMAAGSSVVVEVKAMKEKLKMFNLHFEEICRVQSHWVVFDEQLREEIRIALEKILLPAYGSFIGRFHNVPELSKYVDKYVKYGVDDIGDRLNDLFQGENSVLEVSHRFKIWL